MTQQQLATAAGVSRSTIGALEPGQCRHLRVETLMLICIALDLSADYLLGIDKPDTLMPIDLAMFPLVISAEVEGVRKCPACDCLLKAGIAHTEEACIFLESRAGEGDRVASRVLRG